VFLIPVASIFACAFDEATVSLIAWLFHVLDRSFGVWGRSPCNKKNTTEIWTGNGQIRAQT